MKNKLAKKHQGTTKSRQNLNKKLRKIVKNEDSKFRIRRSKPNKNDSSLPKNIDFLFGILTFWNLGILKKFQKSKNKLKFGTAWRARESDSVADVLHAGDVAHKALEPQPVARVRYAAISADRKKQIKVIIRYTVA